MKLQYLICFSAAFFAVSGKIFLNFSESFLLPIYRNFTAHLDCTGKTSTDAVINIRQKILCKYEPQAPPSGKPIVVQFVYYLKTFDYVRFYLVNLFFIILTQTTFSTKMMERCQFNPTLN